MELVSLTRTCIACPSQWDAYDSDGNYYYIRYRWGHLTVNKNDILDNRIFEASIGDRLDGFMTDKEMLEATGFTVPSEIFEQLDTYPWMEE